jgi:Recombination endonuclease VII
MAKWTATNLAAGTKRCPKCQTTKPLSDFYFSKSRGGGGYAGLCKICSQAATIASAWKRLERDPDYNARWHREHRRLLPEHYRRRELKRRFGISLEEFDDILSQQGGVCALCQGPPRGRWKRFVVDHDHQTGRIRALLCLWCNSALGFAQDSPELLRSMAEYVKQHQPPPSQSSSPHSQKQTLRPMQ